MICVSLAEPTPAKCLAALRGLPFAEIRLDRMRADDEGVVRIFSGHPRLIATCRPGRHTASRRLALLRTAIAAGAAYVDIEVEAGASYKRHPGPGGARGRMPRDRLPSRLRRTPSRGELGTVVERCFASGADIAKIACRVRTPKDNARLLGLLDDARALVVIGLGRKGVHNEGRRPAGRRALYVRFPARGRETAGRADPPRILAKIIRQVADA